MKNYTLLVLKPDVIDEHIEQYVLNRLKGRNLIAANRQEIRLSRKDVLILYPELASASYFDDLVEYLQSGPAVTFIVTGSDALGGVNQLVGHPDPTLAAPGTFRKDFGKSFLHNGFHASSFSNADHEICHFYDLDRNTNINAWILNAAPESALALA
ncbi:MAG: nucleoside-diphosphate kinase [bacterium]